jgi:hypothetical protein
MWYIFIFLNLKNNLHYNIYIIRDPKKQKNNRCKINSKTNRSKTKTNKSNNNNIHNTDKYKDKL